MDRTVFVTPIHRVVIGAALALALATSALAFWAYADSGFPTSLVTAVSALVVAGFLALGLRNRQRPVLEVSRDAITFGPIASLSRKRVPLDEVAGVSAPAPRGVVLETVSGGKLRVPLRLVRRSERQAAREAIERAVAERRA